MAAVPREITGNPDPRHISTSYTERQNLTMRMQMHRIVNPYLNPLLAVKGAIGIGELFGEPFFQFLKDFHLGTSHSGVPSFRIDLR